MHGIGVRLGLVVLVELGLRKLRMMLLLEMVGERRLLHRWEG